MPKRDLFTVILDQRVVVAVGILVGLIVGGLYFVLMPRTYSATTTLYVASQLDNPDTAYQGSLLSQNRVKSYQQLLESPKLADDVSARLGGNPSPDEIERAVTVTSQNDTVLIDVTVDAPTASRAALVANTYGQAFIDTVARLEQPSVAGQAPPVTGRIALAAQPPAAPSDPELVSSLVVGALVGLVLGMAGAYWRMRGDRRIDTAADLADVAGAPVLGEVPADGDVDQTPLVLRHAPLSPSAEGYRKVRTNLQFVNVDGKVNVIVATSAGAQEGKSTTLSNLALALKEAGSRVLLIDADLRRPRLAELFGVEGSVGLSTVLSARADAASTIQRLGDGLDLIASGATPPNPSELLGSVRMSELIDAVRPRYDWVLIDSPPVLPVADALVLANLADGVVVLARNEGTTQPRLEQACSGLRFAGAKIVGTVLTMTKAPARRGYLYGYYHSKQVSGPGTDAVRVELDEAPTPTPSRRS